MSVAPVRTLVLGLFTIVLATAVPAPALEKTTRRVIDPDDSWSFSGTGTIQYFNICTGWVWIWSGWSAGERMGVRFDSGPSSTRAVDVSWALTFSGVPSGYGFTGTISVRNAYDCSAAVLASQPYLPPVTSSWNVTVWGGLPVTQRFLIDITWGAPSGFTNGTGLASDHPQAGPTGPTPCGTCFPVNRASNSRYFGIGGAYCPSGVTLSDGLCDVEWVLSANVKSGVIVVDDSWAKVKSLYR